MTLTNSCWHNSFSHLIIILLSTLAVTLSAQSKDDHLYQMQEQKATTYSHNITTTTAATAHTQLLLPLKSTEAATLTKTVETAKAAGENAKISDNKRFDNLFDSKTDTDNLLFHSRHSNASQLIVNLSNSNLMNVHLNGSNSVIATLNLSHNFLSTFNESNLLNLNSLDLSHNNLVAFQLHDNTSLNQLDLSENSLKIFDCIDCKQLQTLNLSSNSLESIDFKTTFDNLINLKYLDLSKNLLTSIDRNLFGNKSNLSDVILACNRISVINKDLFFQLKNLRLLDLSHNDISDIDALSDLASLQILDLSFNRIHISSLQMIQDIVQLTRLSIAGNVMLRNSLRAFAVTWSMMELDYSHVGLCQIPDSLAQSVRILNLYGNFLNIITRGDFDSYPYLHKLILSHNNLTLIEDDALGRLEMLTLLHLDHNKLTQIPASLPSSLIALYMHNNHITELNANNLINLINLHVLDLSNNRIIYMPELALPALITLSMSGCGLESVHNTLTKTCPNLKQLLIDGNLIKCAQLMEIEQCYDNDNGNDDEGVVVLLTNEYINDDIHYNQVDDFEREERHLNSISHFPNNGGFRKCFKCHNTNTTKSLDCTIILPKFQPSSSSSSSYDDNNNDDDEEEENVPNCWNEQKLITSFNRTNESSVKQATAKMPEAIQSAAVVAAAAAAHTLKDNKFLQNTHRDTKGFANIKNGQNRSNDDDNEGITIMESLSRNSSGNIKIHMNNEIKFLSPTKNQEKAIELVQQQKQINSHNNGLITTKVRDNNSNNRNTIIENGKQTIMIIARNNKSRSIHEIKRLHDNGNASNNKSRNGHSNDDDGKNKILLTTKAFLEYYNNRSSSSTVSSSKNENIDATDNQKEHIMAINHTMNGAAQSYVRASEEHISNHPGLFLLLLTLASFVGIFFTFIVVYVYRCNFINSSRRHRRRRSSRRQRNDSCENINEGRDVLNDNFNEETHNQNNIGNVNDSNSILWTTKSIMNHCDLLPMDVLNATLNQSQIERRNISLHFW